MMRRNNGEASRQIDALGRQLNVPNLGALLRAAGVARRTDMAENYKPGDEMAYKPSDEMTYKPANEMAYKAADEMSRLFGQAGLTLADLPSLAALADAVTAIAFARSLTRDVRELQPRLAGEDRAKLQRSVQYLDTQLDIIERSIQGAVAAARGTSGGTARGCGCGRNVHLHLHTEE